MLMLVHPLPGSSIGFRLIVIVPPESEPDQGGEVAIELETGEHVPVPLKDRFFRVLRILIELAIREDGLAIKTKGVRKRKRIAELYAAQSGSRATVQTDAIKRYVMEIRKAIKSVVDTLVAEGKIAPMRVYPEIIVTIPGRGYRLGDVGLIFVDHTADDESPPRPPVHVHPAVH